MSRRQRDLIPWLSDNGYEWVLKISEDKFVCAKGKRLTKKSMVDEYKMYKYESLDIPIGEILHIKEIPMLKL